MQLIQGKTEVRPTEKVEESVKADLQRESGLTEKEKLQRANARIVRLEEIIKGE